MDFTFMRIFDYLLSTYLKVHHTQVQEALAAPHTSQERTRHSILWAAANTEYAREHKFEDIGNDIRAFEERIPIVDYETLRPYIQRMMKGWKHVLWPDDVNWYAKSSGTTGAQSKYLPVTTEFLNENLLRGGHDALSFWYNQNPNTQLFSNGGRGLVMGGSFAPFTEHPKTKVGDVSALMLHNLPFFLRPFHVPDLETALLPEWESKLEKMAEQAIGASLTNISGVPTWTLVLLRKVLEITGKKNILEVWPNFELYQHGGVSFEPYREQFAQLFPGKQVQYREIYNASEGFFAVQDTPHRDDMLLLLANGIYYEFMPLEELSAERPRTLALRNVEMGKNYALVITTKAGLFRYLIGDTVKFTSLNPYRIKVTGRTKQYINVFGEEVMVENTDRALAQACLTHGATVRDYTVGPVYMSSEGGKGGHEWLLEFDQAPQNLEAFTETLDLELQKLNSDYQAKRYQNIALGRLKLRALPTDTFNRWLKEKGRLGGQNKVPRLANDRKWLEEILQLTVNN